MAFRKPCNRSYPLLFFSGLWSIIGLISNLGLYEYYAPSVEVNLIIFVGIVIFNCTYSHLNSRNHSSYNCLSGHNLSIDLASSSVYRVGLIVAVNCACVLYLLPTLASAMSYVLAGQFTALRSSIFNLEFTTTAQNAIRAYIITPIFTATLLLGIVGLITRIKHASLVLVLGIIGCLVITLVEASRIMLVKTILITLISSAVLFSEGIKQLTKKSKILLILVSIIFIAFCIFITSDRSSDGDIVKVFFTYFFSGPTYLSQLLKNHNQQFILFQDFLFGGATFGGLFNLLLLALSFLGLPVKDTTYIVGSVLTSGNLSVSPTESINAMCTCFFDFIVDWGVAGVIIGPALLALVTSYFANRSAFSPSLKSTALLIFWLYILIRTPFALDTINPAFVITILSIVGFVDCSNTPHSSDYLMSKAKRLRNE